MNKNNRLDPFIDSLLATPATVSRRDPSRHPTGCTRGQRPTHPDPTNLRTWRLADRTVFLENYADTDLTPGPGVTCNAAGDR